MLSNIVSIDELRGLARAKSKDYWTKSIKNSLLENAQKDGWHVIRKNERTVSIKKKKTNEADFTDRVWSLLYRMGFHYMNRDGETVLTIEQKKSEPRTNSVDVVGIDNDVAIVIKCRVLSEHINTPEILEEANQYIQDRQYFVTSINQQIAQPFDRPVKRLVALGMFTSNIFILEEDKKRLKDITFFDEQDLVYYEALVEHLGPAAKYQFLADLLPGKNVPGLNIKVPAIRTKIGDYTCYTFSIEPEYLLKIAYVSHRVKGKGSDVNTYQRMLQKTRLRKIREYIDKHGIFPTNIVINLDKKPTFNKSIQDSEQSNSVMGWLDLRSAYKSAWIIDGQHRLFAYSGNSQASKARLSILAFELLPANVQASLFVSINAEQKSVKRSLLQELYGDLHKDASDPTLKVRSIIARAIYLLDVNPQSPFNQRVQASDDKRDDIRCISWNTLFHVLDSDLYLTKSKRDDIIYGPLWVDDNPDRTIERTVYILTAWFGQIRDAAPNWWAAGAGDGGGLAMNDSVTACINVLRSIFHHLASTEKDLRKYSNQDLFEKIKPYASILGQYFNTLPEEEKKLFRSLRGGQGQSTRMRLCQQAIHNKIPSFNPAGLSGFMEEHKAQTNTKAKILVDRIETTLQKTVIEELKREFGPDDSQWWTEGVPRQIRKKVSDRHEEDDGQRGGKEYYFDLLDYRHIIQQHWSLFNTLLGYGNYNGKDKRTNWINEVNESRRIVAHGSAGRTVSLEQLAQLEEYDAWLQEQIMRTDNTEESPTLEQLA
ncbi:hypothetical protein KSD_47420 [Ktedonobacter sp. SOSP1-85]|uniref:DGQHR domain-containing protein n=1 Tax=Ktedonobacter sp. SOSP1-85 TaxID=2778367 RepID=UPI0019154524|nr:DGQHR domain-containing protein [Ktedonobacter sp. SOSP1-85]GHO76971.1 hypothetical protein KSD_47420 [Ktedonobacter sp. SOSP1-85]